MDNSHRFSAELLLVVIVLVGSVAFVVDAPVEIMHITPREVVPEAVQLVGEGLTEAEVRQLEHLESTLERHREQLAKRRAHLAAAEYMVFDGRAELMPMEQELAASVALPQGTLEEIVDREASIKRVKLEIIERVRSLNRSETQVEKLQRTIAARRLRMIRLTEQIEALRQRWLTQVEVPGQVGSLGEGQVEAPVPWQPISTP